MNTPDNTFLPSFDELDADAAISEQSLAVEEVLAESRTTRSSFLKRFAIGAGSTILSPMTAMGATQKASEAGDLIILNYALTLEYLESSFYNDATRRGHLNSTNAYFSRVVGKHENDHVAAIVRCAPHRRRHPQGGQGNRLHRRLMIHPEARPPHEHHTPRALRSARPLPPGGRAGRDVFVDAVA